MIDQTRSRDMGNLIEVNNEKSAEIEQMLTESCNLLRDALSWFESHDVEKKLGHLPQWVTMARELEK